MKTRTAFVIILILLFTFSYKSGMGQFTTSPLSDKYHPEYHFYPSIDPTGLFYFGGKYYLNWGSAASTDLVHWIMTPYGLARRNRPGAPTGMGTGQPPTGGGTGQPPAGANRNQQTPGAAGNRQPQLNQPQVIGGLSGSAVVDWNNTTGAGKNGIQW